MKAQNVALLLFGAFILSAGAEDDATDRYAILASTGNFQALANDGRKACLREGDLQSPEEMYRAEPTFYGGLNLG